MCLTSQPTSQPTSSHHYSMPATAQGLRDVIVLRFGNLNLLRHYMNRVQYIEKHINFICFDGIEFPKKKALLKFTLFCLFEKETVPGQIVILVPGCFGSAWEGGRKQNQQL